MCDCGGVVLITGVSVAWRKLGLRLITSLIEPSQGWLGWGLKGCRPHFSTEESAPTPCSVLSNEQVTFKCPLLNQSSDKGIEKTMRAKERHAHTYLLSALVETLKCGHTLPVVENNLMKC